SEHYLKSAVNFKFILRTKNILSFDRTLNRIKNKLGSLLFHLCGIEFVGNFRLFERSEFRKFPLSKFPIFQEIRQSRACFLFAYFCFARAKKK
ncbi:TPA: hypothetical protein ACPOJC_001637, partial [Haemophilus influenzae]